MRKPGGQPSAKRQRNNVSVHEHERSSCPSDFCNANNKSVSNPVKISPVKCVLNVLLGKKGIISASLPSIERSDEVTTNSSHFNTENPSTIDRSTFQSSESVNSVVHELPNARFSKYFENDGLNSSETFSGDCSMDLSDDSIIPPTPSPVENFKNKSRISVSEKKNGTTNCGSSKLQRDYKHIKKPSISLSLNRSKISRAQNSRGNERLKTSRQNLSVNKSVLEDENECTNRNDLSGVRGNVKANDKGNDIGTVNFARSSSIKLGKRTFKLPKKGKKADGEKSMSSTMKLEPGRVDEDNDMFLGYGLQVNMVDKGFVENGEVRT